MTSPFALAIKTDHQTVYTLRDSYVSHKDNPTHQQSVLAQLLWEVTRHVSAEEILVHPWYLKAAGVDRGQKLSEFDGVEHKRIKDAILLLLGMNLQPGSLEFDNGLEKILGDLHRHNDSEEESDVPTLEAAMTPEENRLLAHGLEKSKEFFLPERFNPGDGSTITMASLRAALMAPPEQLRQEFLQYLGLQNSVPYINA